MSNELKKKIREANREYKRIESLLTPYGFTPCTTHVFYGEHPFNYTVENGRLSDIHQ